MYNLQYLDLSYNNIESNDIIKCIKDRELPSCLKTINLSGNPCAGDDHVLGLLQECYDELNIIIGIDDDSSNNFEPEIDEDTNDNLDNNDDKKFELYAGEVLDADTVLKSLVERKCQLDKLKDFNIDNAIQELNTECNHAIDIRANNVNSKMTKNVHVKDEIQSKTDFYFDFISNAKDRVSEMLEKSKSEKKEVNSFMSKLREKSLLLREETFSKNEKQLP
jgi:hypothetical protein